MIKESAGQPLKILQGVLARGVQLNIQVTGGRECWAALKIITARFGNAAVEIG